MASIPGETLGVLNVALAVYWLAVALLIISEDREPTSALAWLLVLWALPFVGLVLYFLFGRNWPAITQRSARTREVRSATDRFMTTVYALYAEDTAVLKERVEGRLAAKLVNLIEEKAGAPPLPVRTCDIYGSGEEYFSVLLDDLASARRFIHMNYFIWKNDELGKRIIQVLHERLAEGVEVRILNDFVGGLLYRKPDFSALEDAGAYIGSDISHLSRMNYSNHRKITVIDGEIGHTGGFNIGQEYIDGGKRFPAWRDTAIRITGPGVADLEKLFDMRWFEVYGKSLFDGRYYPDPSLAHGDTMVQTVHHGYDDPWMSATRSYQVAIAGARKRVLLQSPYFVPDASTFDALINAAASGVQVEFMITRWLDKKVPFWAAETYFKPLLEAGARVWLWEPGFFHAKTLTLDDEICAIGTLNMDVRSLKINKELVVWVYDESRAAEHTRLFGADRQRSHELTLDEVDGWSRGRRWRNSVARLFSNLL